MPVEKLSISLPADLATAIEALATESGTTRSDIIREASEQYVACRQAASAAERRNSSINAAIDGFDDLATAWGKDSRGGLSYLAEIRDACDADV